MKERFKFTDMQFKYKFLGGKENKLILDGNDVTPLIRSMEFKLGEPVTMPTISLTLYVSNVDISAEGDCVINGVKTAPGVAYEIYKKLENYFMGSDI